MAVQVEQLITEHLDLWTQAQTAKSTSGRGSNNKIELTGIKKLRELILELAVRGKLVPQDPNDEPASQLLKRIAAEKEALVKAGKLKKQKQLPAITDNEKPFELPSGWEWIRFGAIADVKGGKRLPAGHSFSTEVTPYIYIRVTDMKGGTISSDNLVYISEETQKLISKYTISSDDLYITIAGTIGAVGKVPNQFEGMNLTENAAKIVFNQVNKLWLSKVLNSQFMYSQFKESSNQQAQPKLALHRIESSLLCLPPKDEQQRIVAKVDELMALCDQLEQQSYQQLDAHNQLVDALLATLTQSQNADELASNWQRLAAHFDKLFTTEYSIDALKQTILQLAVMGKLVKQDPNDEPASELLKRIAAEKDALVKAGKIKKQKPLPPISDDEKPFELPEGWSIERVGNLVSKLGSGSTPRGGQNAYVSAGIPFLRSQNIWNDGIKTDDIAYIDDETHKTMANTVVFPNDVLLNITGASLGRSTIFPETLVEANVSQHVTIIRLCEAKMVKYFHLSVMSPMFQKLVWNRQVGMAIEGLSKKVLEMFEFPLPPIAEQARIVEKVNQLFEICDELSVKMKDSKHIQSDLAEALVEQVVT